MADREQSGDTSRTSVRLRGLESDDVQISSTPGDHSDMEGNDCKCARYSSENDSQPQEIQGSDVKDCSGDASIEQETDSENQTITDHSGAEHAHGESANGYKDKPDGVTIAEEKEDKEQSGNTSRTPHLGGPASDDVQTSSIPRDHSDMEGNDCKRARYSSEANTDSQPKDCSDDTSLEQETDSENLTITDNSVTEQAHGESATENKEKKRDGVTAADEACSDDIVQLIRQLEHETDDKSGNDDPSEEVYSSIVRILREYGVEEHQIRRNYNDPLEIIVYQHGAKNHEQLKSKLSSLPDCQPFKIKTFEFSLNFLCSTHLAAGTLSGPSLPFALERSKVATATIGLVLKGRETGGDPASRFGEEYYGVSTAHAILEQHEREKLYVANITSDEHEGILNRVEEDFRENPWTLRAGNDGSIRITETPIFSYGLKSSGLEWFKMFLHDIVIFKLDKVEFQRKGWIDEHPVKSTKWVQIHTSPFTHAHDLAHSKIIGILKVYNRLHIAMLEKARVKIVVGNTTGFIVKSPLTTRCFGLLICFKANFRLWAGQSGSIVYVIKKDSTDLLILGMLVAQQAIKPDDDSPPVYECAVMWPAINQIRAEHAGRIADLSMVDYDTKEYITLQSMGAEMCSDSPINEIQKKMSGIKLTD